MVIRSFNILWINCCGPLGHDCCPHIRNQSQVPPGHSKDLASHEAATFPRGNCERPNNQRHSATSCPLSPPSISTGPAPHGAEIRTVFLTLAKLNTSGRTKGADPVSRRMSDGTTSVAPLIFSRNPHTHTHTHPRPTHTHTHS